MSGDPLRTTPVATLGDAAQLGGAEILRDFRRALVDDPARSALLVSTDEPEDIIMKTVSKEGHAMSDQQQSQTHTKRIVLEIGGMGEGVHICFLDPEGKTEEIDFISYVDHPQAYVKRRADEIAAEQNAEFCGWLCYTIEGEPYLEEWEDLPAELFE